MVGPHRLWRLAVACTSCIVFQSCLDTPQLLLKFGLFAVLSVVPKANSTRDMCSNHRITDEVVADCLAMLYGQIGMLH